MSELYLIDYYSRGAYKNKIIRAKNELQAIKKVKIKNVEKVRNINLQNFSKNDFIKLIDRCENKGK